MNLGYIWNWIFGRKQSLINPQLNYRIALGFLTSHFSNVTRALGCRNLILFLTACTGCQAHTHRSPLPIACDGNSLVIDGSPLKCSVIWNGLPFHDVIMLRWQVVAGNDEFYLVYILKLMPMVCSFIYRILFVFHFFLLSRTVLPIYPRLRDWHWDWD